MKVKGTKKAQNGSKDSVNRDLQLIENYLNEDVDYKFDSEPDIEMPSQEEPKVMENTVAASIAASKPDNSLTQEPLDKIKKALDVSHAVVIKVNANTQKLVDAQEKNASQEETLYKSVQVILEKDKKIEDSIAEFSENQAKQGEAIGNIIQGINITHGLFSKGVKGSLDDLSKKLNSLSGHSATIQIPLIKRSINSNWLWSLILMLILFSGLLSIYSIMTIRSLESSLANIQNSLIEIKQGVGINQDSAETQNKKNDQKTDRKRKN